jgi:hypothetical protein
MMKTTRPRSVLWASGMAAAGLLSYTMTAYAFGTTECAGERFGSDLVCTAGDVSITNIRIIGDTSSCIGGESVTLDLEATVNFATPNRWDIGIFISNDGRDPQLLVANGGATSCAVDVLAPSSPFLNLDGPPDICGDGNNNIGGGTGNGIEYMPGVTVFCQAISGSGGNLYIPYVVSWDNQASPAGGLCTSNADPVPNTKSKCNAPTVLQGTVTVVVLPTLTKTDGITFISPGATTNYTVDITNTTGVALSGAVFKDSAVAGITVNSVSCTAAGGAICPITTVADMQGAGITIPAMPVNSSVTFTINATLDGTPPDTLTNTASVTVGGQTNSASDTNTLVGTIAIIPPSLTEYGSSGTLMVFNYTLYNFGVSSDTISLSALSSQGWAVQIRNAADTGTISSLTIPAGGSADFIIKVQIPGGAALGTVDTTTINATSGNNPSNTATATANTTVSEPLTLTPDNTGSGGKGSSVFYDHRVQNNTASSQAVTFSTAFSGACAGWTAGIYKSDKVTPIPPATVTLTPFGGYEDIVVKVTVPSGAATGSTCTVTTTAIAGGNSDSVTDTTTVKDLILYSDPGYTDESYIYPVGNAVYARAFGALATTYNFKWYDSSGALKRTSPDRLGPGILPDTYDPIPLAGPLGTWRVDVIRKDNGALFAQTFFYVGPDHLNASYTGPDVPVNGNATVTLSLHDKYNHVVPLDPATGNVVQGNPPLTKDPLKITVTVSGSSTIVSTTLTGAVIFGQTVTGRLDGTTGTATITISDSVTEVVTITPTTYNSALYGSPTRDEAATVRFVIQQVRILDWREVR